jgi:hypothetical protein
MIYYLDLYNNISSHEPLGHELHTKMHTNTLETTLLMFVCSSFLSFGTLFHEIMSPKFTN